jgi:hypothetical protein
MQVGVKLAGYPLHVAEISTSPGALEMVAPAPGNDGKQPHGECIRVGMPQTKSTPEVAQGENENPRCG